MTLTRRTLLIALVVLVAALVVWAGIAWWKRNYERVDEWVDMPRTGEARTNPLYVLKLALRADGVKAEAMQRLPRGRLALGERDTVLMFSDPRSLSRNDSDALLAWVERGGHLLLRTPAPGVLPGNAQVPIFQRLELVQLTVPPACTGLDVRGEDPHVEFCGGRRFKALDTAAAPLLRWGDPQGGEVFMRLPHGKGTIDVLAEFDFLTNDKLKDGPHIALTRQLLAPNYRAGTMHLVYAAQMPSFWSTLLRQSWMVWGPLLLALLAWLWRRGQRFGPLLPSVVGERRSLLEHIVASGEHIYRYGYGHLLHEAARNAFLARLRRRDPQAAALTGDTQAALLAERFGISAADVRDALATPIARDHAAFRSRVATLVRMRNLL